MRRTLRRLVAAVDVALAVALLAAGGLAVGALAGFQPRASDSLFPSAATDNRIVVVGIDHATVVATGFPTPRDLHAALADDLAHAGAKVVAWDVIFEGQGSGPDPAQSNQNLADRLRELPAAILAEGIATTPRPASPLLTTLHPVAPLPQLAAAATSVAHTGVTRDPTDGIVRSLPLVVQTPTGELVPALSLEAFRALFGQHGPVTLRPNGVQAAGRFIPTGSHYELRVNFASGLDTTSNTKSVVSALAVLQGRVPASRFRGKVVLIGAIDPLLGDTQLVPVDKSGGIPGVLVHANALNTMLTASYLQPVSNTQAALWVALLALLTALAVLMLPIWLAAIVSVALGVGYLFLAFARFDAGHVLNLAYPFLGLALAFVASLAVRYFTEIRQRRRVSTLFAQYVPEAVAKRLVDEGRVETAAEGERLDASLLFCDMRGFTALSTTLTPTQVREMLNHFYELVTDIVLGTGGTVLKFVGDEVFAVFGAPLPIEHHPQVAIDCAIEIQRRAPELDAQLADLGIAPVQFGIGLNSGDVIAAHVGGGRRRQYDVVGDTVNLASRLCGQAGRGEIVITGRMLALLDRPPVSTSMGPVQLKGITDPVELFQIVAGTEHQPTDAAPRAATTPQPAHD